MSLYGALRSGVSSLFANSQRMAMISDNIANVNTVGYKRVDARFSSFVTQSSRRGLYNSGGVISLTERENAQQGILEPTSFSTDLAITGTGFFVVTDSVTRQNDGSYVASGDTSYTRAGQFRKDSNGNLVNSEGQYLLSWGPETGSDVRSSERRFTQTNELSRFEVVNIEQQALDPIHTSRIDLGVNLAAATGVGLQNAFSVESTVVDRQGSVHTLSFTFVKPSATNGGVPVANTWLMFAGITDDSPSNDPLLLDRIVTGNLDPGLIPAASATDFPAYSNLRLLGEVVFDASGRLASINAEIDAATTYHVDTSGTAFPTTITAAAPRIATSAGSGIFSLTIDYDADRTTGENTSGANTVGVDTVEDRVDLAVNLGSLASTTNEDSGRDGLTQYGGGGGGGEQALSTIKYVDQDGRLFSGIDSVSVAAGGVVEGFYSNGETRALYQVPVFTFANPNGLRARSGNLFAETAASGMGIARISGTSGAGTIVGSAVENSATDIATEFSNMIITQRAYSAATRMITTTDEMLQELSNSIR